MVRVQLSAPRGVGPDGEGFNRFVDMPTVPRVGETVALGEPDSDDERTYRIHGVHWYPDARNIDVYIVLRD